MSKYLLIIAVLLSACGPRTLQTQVVMNQQAGVAFKNPVLCNVSEVSTSWLAKNVYAVCEDSAGNVITPIPGNATSGGQAIVNMFSGVAAVGAAVGAASQIPGTFQLVSPSPVIRK